MGDVVKRPKRKNRAATGLRLAGASYEEIAEILDYESAEVAQREVHADLALVGADAEGREILRNVEGERLNALIRAIWGRAINQSDPEQLQAVKTAVTLIERRAKLYGLDAPTEVVVYTPTTSEIEQWVAEVASSSQPMIEEGDVVHGF